MKTSPIISPDLNADRDRLDVAQESRYWRSLEELAGSKEFQEHLHREFPAQASEWADSVSRRNFLKLMGASLALAGVTGCTLQPASEIVPYVKQPENLVPGKPLYFATAREQDGFASGILVESHEGHPTKIEGNPDHPANLGASCIFDQAAILDLYDPDRSQAVLHAGEISTWEIFLTAMNSITAVQESKKGSGIRILSETVTSPALGAQFRALLQKFPLAQWCQYQPISRDNVRDGAQMAFGEIVETHFHLEKARIIVSLDADFLFRHPEKLRHTREFANGRRLTAGIGAMNRLYVVESTPTTTGSMADHRLPVKAGEIDNLARQLAGALQNNAADSELFSGPHAKWLAAVFDDLQKNRGASVVIAGEQQPAIIHALAHAINASLGNVDRTVTYTNSAEANPIDQMVSLRQLTRDISAGEVELLVILGGNPAFNAPVDLDLANQLSKVKTCVQLSLERNETSKHCHWHIPQTHFLEAWGDTRSFDGLVSIVQPLILPLYQNRSAYEVLAALIQQPVASNYEIVRDHWRKQNVWADFEKGWRRAVHDGFIAGTALPSRQVALKAEWLELLKFSPAIHLGDHALELTFHPDPSIWDGRLANNGWLQELSKPITKLTWDNAALISPALAQKKDLSDGNVVELRLKNRTLRLPVLIVPGQAENSIALALGHGRKQVGHVGAGTGFDAYQLRTSDAMWFSSDVEITKTKENYPLAITQQEHAVEGRDILFTAALAQVSADPQFVNKLIEAEDAKTPAKNDTLYNPKEHAYSGYRWGMTIDLNTCIGCNACVIACQSENNIPVVGKDQVSRGRGMAWIRIDAYFRGGTDNPEVNHMPVPCMHCENAPCELVCPVAATVHDHEGLNLMVYNRCVGTRYCSNNCPYKVRRFNFLQYADFRTPSLKPMRNPNVTVRSRGVMEKCSYCIQRISAIRITSEEQNRRIKDGEVVTACQQACPAKAIVFGDISDPHSEVSRIKAQSLDYKMLGTLNTRPRTTYEAKVRNPNPALAADLKGRHA